jgi:aryl-alcohol dehydrogenase-like predicted oxidoreductase
MEYRQLGRSGLKVSTITLGTITMGGKVKFARVGEVGQVQTAHDRLGGPDLSLLGPHLMA